MTTTRDVIQAGSERLRVAGSDTPRLDAEILLAYAIGVDRTAVIAHGDAPVGPGAESSFLRSLERREAGEPIAYIRGFREFHGIVIVVDPRALIPRPETEALVDRALVEMMARLTLGPPSGPGIVGRCRVIDVGTGSGAIAVAIAVALRKRGVPPDEVELAAVDVSTEALELARENTVGHAVGDRLVVQAADLLPPRSMSEPWDVVVANLPYIRSDALASAPHPTSFEPVLALDGGPDGLAIIGRLFEQLTTTLAIDGVALLEIGADQGDAIMALAAERLPSWSCTIVPDLAGLPRMAVVQRPRS